MPTSKPTLITTGASNSGVGIRLEINDFVQKPMYFSLYIQALARMQDDDQGNTASHFQVGGIHGLPYSQWDNAGGEQSANPKGWAGYCTHGTVLFPTWHRPYTALYEQIIHGHAVDIANTYTTPDKAEWQRAAKSLRLPFWDWTLIETKGVPPDELLTLEEVNITIHNGTTVAVKNPLLFYKFHPIEKTFKHPFDGWQTTMRCSDINNTSGKSHPEVVVNNIESSWIQRNSALIALFTEANTWLTMSNHSADINPNYAGSLERIHDNMHTNIGGREAYRGHMSSPEYAGHDPIFFLHHANVDRLLWMWQIIHFKQWIEPSSSQGGTWTIPRGSTVDATTGLAPFWSDPEQFWTSDNLRKPQELYFTYPVLKDIDLSNPEGARKELLDRISKQLDIPAAFPWASSLPVKSKSADAEGPLGSPANYLDWRVHIQSEKNALSGSYSVYIFLGDVPEASSEWTNSPSLVGIDDVFARENPEQCANCSSRPNALCEGVVFLGPALNRIGLSSYDPDVVVPYLTDNLHWRVSKVGHGQIPVGQLESLQVTVISVPIRVEVLPRPVGEVTRHTVITRGRQGGADDAE